MSTLTRDSFYTFEPSTLPSLVGLVEAVAQGWARKRKGNREAYRQRFFPHTILISEDRERALFLNEHKLPLGVVCDTEDCVDINYNSFTWNEVENFDALTGDFKYRQGNYDEERPGTPYYSYVTLYDPEETPPTKNKTSMRKYLALLSTLESIISKEEGYEVNIYDAPKPCLSSFETCEEDAEA